MDGCGIIWLFMMRVTARARDGWRNRSHECVAASSRLAVPPAAAAAAAAVKVANSDATSSMLLLTARCFHFSSLYSSILHAPPRKACIFCWG
jgi:hypothetical protein